MSGPDSLFLVRNNFCLGAFQAAINDGNVAGLSDAEALERDVFVYRSYVALGSYQVLPLVSPLRRCLLLQICPMLPFALCLSSPTADGQSGLIVAGSATQLVIDEINSSAPTALQAVKLLALYLSGSQEKVRDLSHEGDVLALSVFMPSGSETSSGCSFFNVSSLFLVNPLHLCHLPHAERGVGNSSAVAR